MSNFSDDFGRALHAAKMDHQNLGDVEVDDNWTENGAMRAVGVSRSDTLKLAESFVKLLDDAPDEAVNTLLLTFLEIAISTGVHLERARHDALEGFNPDDLLPPSND